MTFWKNLTELWDSQGQPAGEQTGPTAVDPEQLERILQDAQAQLPVPVFWLLGKTQSGKTSIIQALTGSTQAEIGNGLQPCTRTAQEYPFPSSDQPLIRFLDTRGLGEVNYDPTEDIAFFAEQAHLLVAVVKAMDHAQGPLIEALRTIGSQRPNWPLVVVQTCLHQGYPSPEFEHLQPYPDQDEALQNLLPQDLAKSLAKQRELFAGMNARFVAVDFTQPEDGYTPVFYGLNQLWETIEEVLPLGLRAVLEQNAELRKTLRDAYFRTAHPRIVSHALAAGAAAAVPVPLLDVPAVVAVQTKMCWSLAAIYQQPMDSQRLKEIAGGLGIGFLGRLGVRELAKIIPGWGSAVAGLYAAASTYALGRTLCAYFSYAREGDLPSPEMLKTLYQDQFEQARETFQAYLKNLANNKPEHSSQ